MLFAIMKDFCNANTASSSSNLGTVSQENSVKSLSNTLNNSLLSIVNRYIMCNPEYFFGFLKNKLDITPFIFYENYFKNMQHLTSRTAMYLLL